MYVPLVLITKVPLVGPETGVELIVNKLPSSSPSLANNEEPLRIPSSTTVAESSPA